MNNTGGKNGNKDSDGGPCKKCPHYVIRTRSCGLFSEGFYLPLRANVIAFCMTTRYRKCPVYYKSRTSRGIDGAPGTEDPRHLHGRRRHPRIPEQRSILLQSCDWQGVSNGGFSDSAVTVDFSPGGMRVIVSRDVPPDTPLRFDFESDFFIPRFHGVAWLCWYRPLPGDTDRVEAGLVIEDATSRDRLSHELGYS